MAKVLVTDTYLEDIGDAIRSVNGEETTYKPSEMAAVIDDFYIEPTGTKTITENGTGIDVKDYASADVNVPNSYSASDEGKVVDEGELVAQGSQTITENGTYDTTLISELIANISGGGGGGAKNILGGTTEPTSAEGSDGDIYIQYTDLSSIPSGYTLLEYIQSNGTQSIDTGVLASTSNLKLEAKMAMTGTSGGNGSALWGGSWAVDGFFLVCYNGVYRWHSGGKSVDTISASIGAWTSFVADKNGISIDGVLYALSSPSGVDSANNVSLLTTTSGGGIGYKASAKIAYVRIYDGQTLVRNLVPVKRNSDDVLGMYDLVNDVFYTNSGTGTFTAGEEMDGTTPIDVVYLKVDGSWIILEDGNWDDVNTEGGGGYTEVNVYAIWFNPNTSANSVLSGGIKMIPKENLKAAGVRFFARGTTASVYISDINGNTLASKIGATLVDGQWNDVLFDSPITLEKDVAYMVWGSNANYPMKYRDSAISSAQFVVVNGSYYSRSRDTLPNNAESGTAYGVDLIITMYKS